MLTVLTRDLMLCIVPVASKPLYQRTRHHLPRKIVEQAGKLSEVFVVLLGRLG